MPPVTLKGATGTPLPLLPSCCLPSSCRGIFFLRGSHKHREKYWRACPLTVIGGLNPSETSILEASRDRVYLVMCWLHRLLVSRRLAGGIKEDAPIVSRIYQVLSGLYQVLSGLSQVLSGIHCRALGARTCRLPSPLRHPLPSKGRTHVLDHSASLHQENMCLMPAHVSGQPVLKTGCQDTLCVGPHVRTANAWWSQADACVLCILCVGASVLHEAMRATTWGRAYTLPWCPADGMQGYQNAYKLTTTPFPFPFAQSVALMLHLNAILAPLVLAHWAGPVWLAGLTTFLTVFSAYVLNEVGLRMAGGGPHNVPHRLLRLCLERYPVGRRVVGCRGIPQSRERKARRVSRTRGSTALKPFCTLCLAQVAREIEEPFKFDPNDLPGNTPGVGRPSCPAAC